MSTTKAAVDKTAADKAVLEEIRARYVESCDGPRGKMASSDKLEIKS